MPRNKTGVNTYATEVYDDNGSQVRFIPKDYQNFTLDTPFKVTTGLLICSSGSVTVVTSSGTTITIPNLLAGFYLLGEFTQINTSGTTVSSPEDNIILVY